MHCQQEQARIATKLVVWLSIVWSAVAVRADIMTTYVTGETPSDDDVIFKVTFDPAIAGSGVVSVAVTETRGFGVDGIDFVPGTGGAGGVAGAPTGKITKYNVKTGAILPDLIGDTSAIGPASTGSPTHPSTVLSTPTHVYYVENQFGFDGSTDHRILRTPFAGGPVEVVFDGSGTFMGGDLVEFEGLEIVGDRLYFFAQDPAGPAARAMMSIGLDGAGLWDGAAPEANIVGLGRSSMAAGSGPGISDGSDEIDFDPGSGLLFGTNIFNGEFIAYDPFLKVEVVPGFLGSSSHFIDSGHLLSAGFEIDGIRSDGAGHLVFSGRGGIIGAIDIGNVLTMGAADPTSVYSLFDGSGAGYVFDDLTPLMAVPEPSAFLILCVAAGTMALWQRRKRVSAATG